MIPMFYSMGGDHPTTKTPLLQCFTYLLKILFDCKIFACAQRSLTLGRCGWQIWINKTALAKCLSPTRTALSKCRSSEQLSQWPVPPLSLTPRERTKSIYGIKIGMDLFLELLNIKIGFQLPFHFISLVILSTVWNLSGSVRVSQTWIYSLWMCILYNSVLSLVYIKK